VAQVHPLVCLAFLFAVGAAAVPYGKTAQAQHVMNAPRVVAAPQSSLPRQNFSLLNTMPAKPARAISRPAPLPPVPPSPVGSPNAPVLFAPSNGSTGATVSPTLDVCVSGVHGIMEAQKGAAFESILNRSLLTAPDGMPAVWAGQLFGLNVVGTATPPFRPLIASESEELQLDLSKLRPNFFWLSLSTIKLERFMEEYLPKLDTKFMVGVGAAFDRHTGRVQDAPDWTPNSL
jgi:Glycosyl transferase WecG/TagA/CpsF family